MINCIKCSENGKHYLLLSGAGDAVELGLGDLFGRLKRIASIKKENKNPAAISCLFFLLRSKFKSSKWRSHISVLALLLLFILKYFNNEVI